MQEVISAAGNLVDVDDAFTLRMGRKPEAIIAEARLCANALVAEVRRNNWAQVYGKREHLFFEAWAFLAQMYRVTPRTRETRYLDLGGIHGYEAVAEAFHIPSQTVISTAESMCLNDEPNWDMRPTYDYVDRKRVQTGETQVPLFQLRSMAQTRAQAKALKGPFSWIIAMAGFAPVPVDELGGESLPRPEQPIQAPRQKAPAAANEKISAKQASRIWGVAYGANVSKQVVQQILEHHGVKKADDVTAGIYDQVIADIEKAGQPAEQKPAADPSGQEGF